MNCCIATQIDSINIRQMYTLALYEHEHSGSKPFK